jgi:3-methyladenine DNA glycosylase Tag
MVTESIRNRINASGMNWVLISSGEHNIRHWFVKFDSSTFVNLMSSTLWGSQDVVLITESDLRVLTSDSDS